MMSPSAAEQEWERGEPARMDHTYVDENQVAERYLMGKLSPGEAALFEEHSLGCQECLDRLEAAEELRLGLRQVAAREAANLVVQASLLARLARLARSRQAGLALAALLVLLVLPTGLLMRRVGQLGDELDRTREALARRGPATASPPAPPGPRAGTAAPGPSPGTAPGASSPLPDDERRHLEEELAAERRRSRQLADALAGAGRPQVNLPILTLGPERSAAGAQPATRLDLAPATAWVVLSLELPEAAYPAYRATLLGPDGGVRWQGSGLTADAAGSLALGLPARLLAAGDFRFRVEGVPAAGRPVPVAVYAFRVAPSAAVRPR
jgi:hypothetical protein